MKKYALDATICMRTSTGLPVMSVTSGTTLNVPAWKPCQESMISGYAKTVKSDDWS